ncbi:MAG TPA: RNA polymerase sigma factor [Bryobacteraceae bacterium]|nr:RNA polymerase sigma factor [Bryobacteraceae bacterium]
MSWRSLVERIRIGDSAACEELYSTAFTDVRRWFSQRLGVQYADDRTHDTYLATIRAIINGDPREPDRLPGFIHVIAHRHFCSSLRSLRKRRFREIAPDNLALLDPACDLDRVVIAREKRDWAKRALCALPPEQGEVLERFYVLEQSAEQICREMGLTETQFRLLKWRAKAQFGAIAKKRLQGQALKRLSRRAVAGQLSRKAIRRTTPGLGAERGVDFADARPAL